MHTIFCILGKTGSGKDSLVNEVSAKEGLTSLISYTTRPRRNNEGDSHIFVTEEDYLFEENILVDTKIGNYYYWSTKEQIEKSDFYIINPNALSTLKEKVGDTVRIITIYITAPEAARLARLRLRDKEVNLDRIAAEEEQFRVFEEKKDYDYCIHNNHFDCAAAVLQTIVNYERNKHNYEI